MTELYTTLGLLAFAVIFAWLKRPKPKVYREASWEEKHGVRRGGVHIVANIRSVG